MNEPNSESDKNFRALIEKWGGGDVTLMTKEIYPEIMNLYAQLCKEKGVPERPVYMVESGINSAAVDKSGSYIILTSTFIENHTPLEIRHVFLKTLVIDEPTDISDKRFRASVRKEYGGGHITLMTKETHPEIMNLYAQLCKEKNVPEYPVYLIDYEESSAAAYPSHSRIIITSAYIESHTPLEICAVLGHEGRHLSKRQRRCFKNISASIYMAPVTLVSFATAAAVDSDSPLSFVQKVAAILTAAAAARACGFVGNALAYQYIEHDSDKAAAEFAGPEATLGYLEKIKRRYDEELAGIPDWLKNRLDPKHPLTEKRIARIKREFGLKDRVDAKPLSDEERMARIKREFGGEERAR